MKHRNVTGWISAVLLLAVLTYLGLNIYDAVANPFKTAYAVRFESYDYETVSGLVVRDETVVTYDRTVVNITRSEGEKVGKGQTLAVVYQSSDAETRQEELDKLESRLSLLSSAVSASGSVTAVSQLDERIISSILDVNSAVATRSLKDISDQSDRLKNLVFTREHSYSDTSELQEEMADIQSRIDQLQALSQSETTAISAPVAGLYSAYVDGYESALTPELLDQATVSTLEEAQNAKTSSPANIGKLISGSRWYYLTVMEADLAYSLGSSITVRLTQDSDYTFDMDVERIGPNESGRCAVVLSCDRHMSELTMYRQLELDVIFESYTGLRVPKKAIKMDEDGGVFVYVMEGINIKQKYVDIISETGSFYVVTEDRSSTSNLWSGDEVVVSGRGLYDGKVID